LNNWYNLFFYPENHEYGAGLRSWAACVLMVGILLATGYLEGLEQTSFYGK